MDPKYNTLCWNKWCKFHKGMNTCGGRIANLEEMRKLTGYDCPRDRIYLHLKTKTEKGKDL